MSSTFHSLFATMRRKFRPLASILSQALNIAGPRTQTTDAFRFLPHAKFKRRGLALPYGEVLRLGQ
jgi:hypothetical protein